MSLESEVKTLRESIDALTESVSKLAAHFVGNPPEGWDTTPKDGVPQYQLEMSGLDTEEEKRAIGATTSGPITVATLKTACLDACKTEEGSKVKVKALLKEFGANVVGDLSEDQRPVVYSRLQAGEF